MAEDKTWFEMREHRRRRLDAAAWVPLRAANELRNVGRYGYLGHSREFHGVGTLAAFLDRRSEVSKLGWMDIGIAHSHRPHVDGEQYTPADHFISHDGDLLGIHLVLEGDFDGAHELEWHLHPDLVLGLGLRREGDIWLSPDDGYETVVTVTRDAAGAPRQVAMRTEYLKDFLAARRMALYVTSYRERREVVTHPTFEWKPEEANENTADVRWEGRSYAIHEGGMAFGGRTAVVHVAHADFDGEQDVPILPHPTDGKFDSKSWTLEDSRPKLYIVSGELWRQEWVEPGEVSPRVRGDERPSTASFVVDGAGTARRGDELIDEGRWLWFRPDVVPAFAHRRGGSLSWHTRDTGALRCVPSGPVNFGVNKNGLVTVYAKDVGRLPGWQQRIWAAYNVAPDGGVAEELQSAQIRGRPAKTQAAESYLLSGLQQLREGSLQRFGVSFVREHGQLEDIVVRCHRFRATDRSGLLALAKDLARVTADLFDVQAITGQLQSKPAEKLGSLKALERLLADIAGDAEARSIMGPLVGIYDLRVGDAHLPAADQSEAYKLARIDESLPLVQQGYQLLDRAVSAIFQIIALIATDGTTGSSSS